MNHLFKNIFYTIFLWAPQNSFHSEWSERIGCRAWSCSIFHGCLGGNGDEQYLMLIVGLPDCFVVHLQKTIAFILSRPTILYIKCTESCIYLLSWPCVTIDAPIGKVMIGLIQEANNLLPIRTAIQQHLKSWMTEDREGLTLNQGRYFCNLVLKASLAFLFFSQMPPNLTKQYHQCQDRKGETCLLRSRTPPSNMVLSSCDPRPQQMSEGWTQLDSFANYDFFGLDPVSSQLNEDHFWKDDHSYSDPAAPLLFAFTVHQGWCSRKRFFFELAPPGLKHTCMVCMRDL